jgi:predicted ribosomally synthesized peptide with SipW-like signal peptide
MMRLLVKLFSLVILIGALVTPTSNAVYSDTETSVGNTFTAGCWSPPSVPVLVSPADNYMASASSEWNLHPVMDWNDSTFVCPGETVTYQYQSFRNDLSHVAYTSGWLTASQIPAPGTPEGVYYWRVKAKDSSGRESDWSLPWKISVDRTPPVTTLKFDTKPINEKIVNGGFNGNLNGWITQGEVVYDSGTARIGHMADDGKGIWENKLSQQIQPGAKNLSFYYNFFSYDTGMDDPGMVVRLNDYNVFYLSASEIEAGGDPNSSGWIQLSFDISQISDPVLQIIFYSGNTGNEFNQSWVYIDNVSTNEVVADDSTSFTLSANEPATIYYSLDGGAQVIHPSNSFNVNDMTVDKVWYYSCDLAGNCESLQSRRIVKDITEPVAITDLEAFGNSKHSVNLTWMAPFDTTVYDIRYSQSPITEGNFYSAFQAPNPPAPRQAGDPQEFDVVGLDSDTPYYFALRAGDAALNWSLISNVVSAATEDEVVDPDINPGDVVINELMWMGTTSKNVDEYVELRNMTDRTIDISGWTVAGATIPAGRIIAPHGYFLISDFDAARSKINVTPDFVVGLGGTNDDAFTLDNFNLEVILRNSSSAIIDVADNGEGLPAAGQHTDPDIHRSMERDATPGNGADASVWHTCFDNSALMHAYWDSGATECGTPGHENLSQAPTNTESTLKLFSADHKISFTVTNISQFNLLKYTLTYDSDSGEQAIIGQIEFDGQDQIEVKDLITGICSSGGVCVYHEGITEIKLEVELSGIINRTLMETLSL